jgi:hypothetical protein
MKINRGIEWGSKVRDTTWHHMAYESLSIPRGMNCSFGDKCNFGVHHIIFDPYPTNLGFRPGEPMAPRGVTKLHSLNLLDDTTSPEATCGWHRHETIFLAFCSDLGWIKLVFFHQIWGENYGFNSSIYLNQWVDTVKIHKVLSNPILPPRNK